MESLDTNELPKDKSEMKNIKSDGSLFKPIVVDEPEIMLQHAKSLSFEQRIVFDQVVKFCKEVMRSKKGAKIYPKPPQLIAKGN